MTLVITSLLIITNVQAQIVIEPKKIQDINSSINITVEFTEDDFEFKKYNGYDKIIYPDGGLTTNIGEPMLPLKNILVALPSNMRATNVKLIDFVEKELSSSYNILPAQAFQKVGVSIKKPAYSFDTDIFSFSPLYPLEKVELIGMTDLAGQGISVVTVYPIQYNSNLKTLKLFTHIKFEIECEIGHSYGDYLPAFISETDKDIYIEKVKEMVINPEDVILQTKQEIQPLAIEPGTYDYVIITNYSWVSAFQTLADWKTQKGIPANIVTTESIYANYTGSTNQAKIRAFIIDAHSNWGSTFFLLGGDNDTIPFHTVTILGDDIPTDTYYSDYDDDWTCEVNVGRASVTGTGSGNGKIDNFISKILTYEKNPPTSDYAKNISLFGFDLDSVTDGEDCKIDIDSLYIPSDWTVTKVYDSYSGNHEDNVDTAVNNGQNLINHIDHSSEYYMGIGYTNHNWGLVTSEVDAFSNGNKQSIWYSIGCWASAFDFSNCIAEHFVRDTDGGGVAFVGNTRYGWYSVGDDDLASLRYDRYFFRSFFNQNHYKLGDLFSDHKMDAYNSMNIGDYNKYIFSELTLLGDPELPLWMNDPSNFDVYHLEEIETGSSSFNVHVENSSGNDMENAYVCLWKDDEVYLINYTDSSGNITFNPSPLTEGIMTVTVTMQDYIPYEGNVSVTSNQPPNTPNTPNPENGATDVNIDTILTWSCSDPDEDPLTYDVYFGTVNPPSIVSSNQTITSFDPGILDFGTTYYWKIIAWDDSDASAQGPIWSFTTIDNDPPNTPSDPNPYDGETNVNINSDISWTGGDPDGDEVTYDVYFGTTTPPPLVSPDQSDTSYDPGTMDYLTTYYWQIEAEDEYGYTTIGSEWSFTTEDEPENYPPEFSDEDPLNGVTNVLISTSTLSVYISDREGDSIDWSIETSPNIGSISSTSENNGTKICSISGLSYDTTYIWYVNATDAGSSDTTSEIYSFTTENNNNPPKKPTITGPTSGKAGTSYTYSITTTDPESDEVRYYINWGDDTNSDWIGPFESGEIVNKSHKWIETGSYIIKVKAKDVYEEESPETILIVTMPRNKVLFNSLFFKLFERFPFIQRLLSFIL
ncbi:hypothetical protein AYK24_10465 [Thermoplasmatales archaeon SG8-52-4]|nr:MAG: hypothetical protein AYK24_10465 [Thermoplasmatales archaeon SG8-52-4]